MDNTEQNRAKIKQLYKEIDEILLVPEYLLLIIDNSSDYYRAFDGFEFNGKTYHRLLGTTGGIKTSTIVFMADKSNKGSSMRDEIFSRIENGRNLKNEMVPAKLEAYRALACSASIPVSSDYNILVVKDCETSFKADYISLDDSFSGEPHMELVKNGDVSLIDSDGYGIISPEVALKWSSELNENEPVSGFCIRNAFCKGMLFPFPFKEFANEVAGKYIVQDIWGNEKDVREVDIILTGSMLKLWSSYSSIEDYLSNCLKNGYTFSVTKTVESEEKESRELNYQFIQSYDLSDEDILKLIDPTITDIRGIMGGDTNKTLLFLKGDNQNEKTFERSEADFSKALMVDERVSQDKYIRGRITQSIRKKIDRAKLGRIRVRGDYNVVSGDPYSLCQSIFNLPVTGLLSAGEVYSSYWDKRNVREVVCFRAPMTCHNNIRRMKIGANKNTRKWYRYMKNVLVTNSWDMLAHALNGMDKDGDLCLTTDNEVLLRKTKNSLPISCAQKKSDKKIVCDMDLVQSNIDTFGNEIGSITNRATSMYEVRSHFLEGTDEYNILSYRIMCCQLMQQNEIDKAKGIISKPMPKYWYDRSAAIKKDMEDGTTINEKIVADKKPKFMIYRYPVQLAEYNSYKTKTMCSAERQFGKSLEQILNGEDWSEEEYSFVQWYYKKMPVGTSLCSMNKVCSFIENKVGKVKETWRAQGKGFDYNIYRSDSEYCKKDFIKLCNIVDQYKDELERCSMMGKKAHLDQDEISNQKDNILKRLSVDCFSLCNDEKMLCNMILDATYGRNKSFQFAWSVCGEAIIENLLEKNSRVIKYLKKDSSGDIEYGGNYYNICFMEVGKDD